MDGWIKIHRKLADWKWRDSPNMVSLFVNLLILASYEDREWHDIVIKKGQVVMSITELCEVVGLSHRQMRTCLSRLLDENAINIKSTNKYSVITICNYEYYQFVEDCERQTKDKQKTNKRQTTKERKEPKERKAEEGEEKTNTNVFVKKKIYDFVDDAMEEAFAEWLEYKKARQQMYKNEKSIKTCYNHLMKIANYDAETAKSIIEQSIANNYQGLFPIKNENANGGNKSRQAGWDEYNAKARTRIAEQIKRVLDEGY